MSVIIVFILWTILIGQLLFRFTDITTNNKKGPFIFLLILYLTGSMIGLSLFLVFNYEVSSLFPG
jgi:hypothetical protein